MTKKEFLDALATNPVISALVTDARFESENELGDRIYHINARKIQGNALNYENIRFVVVDEGKPTEAAYFYQVEELDFGNIQEAGITTEPTMVTKETPLTPLTPVKVL